MAISPSSSVRQARGALAQRLREIRLDADLTARALALAAGWHESKCSRIEHVKTAPSEADIRLWCQVCGAEDQAADLIASLRAADSMYTEWRRLEVTGLRHLQQSMVPLYERTARFRAYQSHVVPGLFQTPAYAAASSHWRNADWRVIGLAPGHIPAATPSTARPAHQATNPAMSSHATGFPKLSIQPTPKRAPTTMAGSSRLT
jgi:transcriptional regulator with XRE-family HTH domain